VTPRTVVIAPDSFKGTVSASDAARAIAEGWLEVSPGDDVLVLPQADGGEGTLDAIRASVTGSCLRGDWLELPDGSAVVELARVCGITLLDELDPLGASTRRLGEAMRDAVESGATALTVALGGSASTDGGTGALSALGMRFSGSRGEVLPDGGGALIHLESVDRSRIMAVPPLTLLVDVTAPLLGPTGAAAVFGPQKGATVDHVARLDAGLARLAALMGADPSEPGMGAAGGTAYGLAAAFGADATSGAEHVARLTGLDAALTRADVVITGEGRFDAQSLTGKVVGGILDRARSAGAVPAVIAGSVDVDPGAWSASLAELAGSARAAMADPLPWLVEAGRRAARDAGRPAP